MLLLLDALDVDVTVPDVLDVDSLPLRASVNGFDVEHLAVSMRQHKSIRHKAQGIGLVRACVTGPVVTRPSK